MSRHRNYNSQTATMHLAVVRARIAVPMHKLPITNLSLWRCCKKAKNKIVVPSVFISVISKDSCGVVEQVSSHKGDDIGNNKIDIVRC